MQIMTKNHRRWYEFVETLDLLIDYERDGNAVTLRDFDPMANTYAILADMGFSFFDISATLKYLSGYGVFSDCALLAYEDKGVWPTSI